MGENLIFTYDNFPCIEPLAQGMESETARLLYETVGPVPMEKLEKVCKNRSTMYVIVSTLRGKLTPGHRIFKSKDGYQLVYDGDVLLKEDNGVLPQARVKLGQRIQALRSSIEAINGELQRLNARKVDVKRQLEIAEVGLLALEELEDCDDSNT